MNPIEAARHARLHISDKLRSRETGSIYQRYPELTRISQFPEHVAIIPDGNRRFAETQNRSASEGHEKGAEVARQLLNDFSEIKEIKTVTLWGFSADNWGRPQEEVDYLMELLDRTIIKLLPDLQEQGGRFIHLGRKDRIPQAFSQTLILAESQTRKNKGQNLAIAIDFGGEDQSLRVTEKAILEGLRPPLTQEQIWDLRDGHGKVRSADLLIRTGGDLRSSDIGWLNGKNTVFYKEDKVFPQVRTKDIVKALVSFDNTERRMGGRPTKTPQELIVSK